VANADFRDFYTDEAGSYETVRYGSRYGRLFRAIHEDAVDRILARKTLWKNAADVASGTGQLLEPLLRHVEQIVANDLTPAMLGVSRERFASKRNLAFCVCDARQLPYADGAFEVVGSARFLHLFENDVQAAFVAEMARIVAPGGLLLADFYSRDARRIFGLPIALYRALLRKRPENDHRVSVLEAKQMVEIAGLVVKDVIGVGNFLLAPFTWLPQATLLRLARFLSRRFGVLSEQFIIVAAKP
jgi:SAM-dependent methyltransferase